MQLDDLTPIGGVLAPNARPRALVEQSAEQLERMAQRHCVRRRRGERRIGVAQHVRHVPQPRREPRGLGYGDAVSGAHVPSQDGEHLRLAIRVHLVAQRSSHKGARERGAAGIVRRVLCHDDDKAGLHAHGATPKRAFKNRRAVEERDEEGDHVRGGEVHLVTEERQPPSHGPVEGTVHPLAAAAVRTPLTDNVLERRTA